MKTNLTNPQKSIWYTEQYYKNTSVNNIGAYIYIYDNINFDVLKQTVNEVVKLNDNMRLKFKKENNFLTQYVTDFNPFDIDIIELSSIQEVIEKTKDFANIPFKIENNFLFKFLLYKLPNNEGGVIINIHHIISDSWTLGLIGKEIANIYCKILNKNYDFNKYPSYLNYIKEENEYLNSSRFSKDKEFWEEKFKTIPEIASIPSYKNNISNNISCAGNRKIFNINSKELNKIKEFCTNYNVSLYNFFMAIYSLYIGKVCNLKDFVIGTPILNRSNFAQKHTMGMFVNTIPLRINLNYNLSFINFVKDITSNTMSSLRHQKYSYQLILEYLRKLNPSVPNLYNVLLSYQITKSVEDNSDIKCVTEWVENGCCADELQIHLSDINNESSITVAYDYKVSKYGEQDILDLHSRILSIINQVIHNNDILLKNIQIVTDTEKNVLLHEFNNTVSNYPYNKTIVDLFEEQVEKTPDNIAVSFENEKLTYKQLDEKSNQLANYLALKNLKVSENIGIFTNRSVSTIIGILAILKLGKTFVPIDPLYPLERINYMINASKLSFILSDINFDKTLDNSNLEIILINDFSSNSTVFNCKKVSKSKNNVYIIFTSGSTGKPKGVTISHRNLINLIWFEKEKSPILENNSKILQFATMSFDVSYQEIFSALLSGNTLVLISDTDRKNISNLINYIKINKISTLFIPPAYLRLLVEDLNNVKILSKSVKYIITAGEALLITPGIKKLLKNNVQIFNHYGPAETHVATTYKVPNNIETTNVSIGTPINNTQIYILDEYNNLCPFNVVGQIAIGGDCVGNGYIDKSLNRNKFIANPFKENSKLYLTGDLGFIDKNNLIQFIGRKDFQVKINGFRIELDEITKSLLNYNGVNSCITIVNEINNKKYIFCYYTSDLNLDKKDIMSFLSSKLPKYMVPTKLIQLDVLPINNNGKIDRNALPKVDLDIEDDFVPATTETQIKLLNIWKEILNMQSLGISNDFFSIGGDSLLSIKLSSFIQKEFNVDININDIFENSTIETLSKVIDNKKQLEKKEIAHISSNVNYYPLSSAQKRIYYSCNIDKNSTLYNIAGGVILDKDLDINKLNNCFKVLIEKNDALRTHFDIKNEEIFQIIDNKVDFEIKLNTSYTNNLNEICSNFIKPFDLSKAPLFRAEIVKLENNKTLFLLDMHHIICDGTSLNVLIQELCSLYNGNQLADKKIDYKDFTLWEQEQFNTKEFKTSKEFWVDQFKDEIPLLNMPTSYNRPSVQSFEGANYYTNLSSETIKKIHKISKSLNITPYMLMLSCYYILLSKYTSQDDIVVGTAISGRELSELSNIIGMFVNSLALRNKIDSSLTFADFTKNIKINCLNCFNHQNYPFDVLVKDLKINRSIARNPLFDTMFIFQNEGYPIINFEGINSQYFIPNNNIAKFDLSLEIVPINDEYLMRFEYCTKLFSEDFIKRFSSHYINILNTILENSQIKLSEIDMLSEKEKKQLLCDFNNTKVNYSKSKSLIDLFEEQVQKTPDDIAVVFEDEQLTYKELNEKTNQVANYLIEQGVSNNSIIGIMLPRSLEMIVAMFAILKCGAAYLPLDPTYPKNRIKYILKDSNVNILLVKSRNISLNNVNCINIDIKNSNIYKIYSKCNLNIIVSPNSLAYVIYTSGSTGNPKGVMITHKNVNNFITGICKKIKFSKVIVSITTICFDIFVLESILPLLNGLTVVVANESEQNIPKLLNALCLKYNVSMIQTTPSKMSLLISDSDSLEYLKHIDTIMLGGEPFPYKLLLKLKELCMGKIYNMYGPTETTVWSSIKDLTNTNNITIGTPIANTTAYILDNNLNILPIGLPGTLYLGGNGVSNGYLNKQDLTNEKFIVNKYVKNEVIYNTGDLAKWQTNGELIYLGRSDFQIKMRGLRIELGEIEKVILSFKNIDNAVVTVSTDSMDRQFLCAYFISKLRISLSELKEYISKFLPNYMVPTYLIQVSDFTYTPNGKIDKKSLPTPEILTDKSTIILPKNKTEQKLLEIFEKLLCISPISTDDNFFDIGGDSLLALKLQIELIKENFNITYAEIFKYNSVKKLSNLLNTKSINNTVNVDYNISYNYSSINKLLKNNSIKFIDKLDYSPIGNVLLTGVTGFLGAHILDYLLTNTYVTVYCLVRKDPSTSIIDKVLDKLHFYFENKYDGLINKRIFIIESDLTQDKLGLTNENLNLLINNISCVINSAALVKHYGNYLKFKEINVTGVEKLINFCKKYDKQLVQISTISVSGNTLTDIFNNPDGFDSDVDFSENDLYIGQSLENVYVRSKFEAERLILEEINHGNLDALILRIGNITNRITDGKFQFNPTENAFANKLKSFIKLQTIPNYILDKYIEFSPVDVVAEAIIKSIEYRPSKISVLHIYNPNHIYINDFINMLPSDYNINVVSSLEFKKFIKDIIEIDDYKGIISNIINDLNSETELVYDTHIKIKSNFSQYFLNKTGFTWPIINKDYIKLLLKNI